MPLALKSRSGVPASQGLMDPFGLAESIGMTTTIRLDALAFLNRFVPPSIGNGLIMLITGPPGDCAQAGVAIQKRANIIENNRILNCSFGNGLSNFVFHRALFAPTSNVEVEVSRRLKGLKGFHGFIKIGEWHPVHIVNDIAIFNSKFVKDGFSSDTRHSVTVYFTIFFVFGCSDLSVQFFGVFEQFVKNVLITVYFFA